MTDFEKCNDDKLGDVTGGTITPNRYSKEAYHTYSETFQ